MADQRQTRGKQRIEMKMIQKEENRVTTFSKRRSGIYKMANEIVTLCGAEVGFMTFTPKGKPYAFAQPSMQSIENQLIDMENPPLMFSPSTMSHDQPLARAHQQAKLEGLNQHCNELAKSLEAEKEKSKAIKKLMKKSAAKNVSGKGWWETPVEELGYEDLLQMNESLEELQKKLCNHINGERRTKNNTAFGPSSSNFGGNPN